MRKIKYLCFKIFLFTASCSFHDDRKIIQYEYNGVVVTRVNDYPKDYFYYGRFDNLDSLPENYILSKFSGIDGLMDGYLIFKKNRTVEVIRVAEDFTKFGNASNLYLKENMENIDFIHWSDSTKNNLDSIARIRDVIELEKKINVSGKSMVRVNYNVMQID